MIGGGMASGGGVAAVGGGGGPQVFVSLSWDYATCCINGCACQQCRTWSCAVTKAMSQAKFNELRVGPLSRCSTTASGDAYSVDCRDCTTNSTTCGTAGNLYPDTVATCRPVENTSSSRCEWTP